jgi:hypothetical protein
VWRHNDSGSYVAFLGVDYEGKELGVHHSRMVGGG